MHKIDPSVVAIDYDRGCIKTAFEIEGPYALFSNAILRSGGEKSSEMVPTYSALKGAAGSIYRKPVFNWHILRCRVMAPIQFEKRGVRLPHYVGGNSDLATYLYLKDVRYQVEAETSWSSLEYFAEDRNLNKHAAILSEALKKGGRLPITLGPTECPAYVRPCTYGEGIGAYDDVPLVDCGVMLHCVLYNTEGYDELTLSQPKTVHLWHAVMKNGEIVFPRPSECEMRREYKK